MSTAAFATDCPASYRALGDGRYRPSVHAQGAWRSDEQHMAPVAGLLAHALQRQAPRADMRLSRISYDIWGMIPAAEGRVTVRTLRPGRTIELLEATLTVGERVVVTARAWRLQAADTTAVTAVNDTRLPPPEESPPWPGMEHWPGGFIDTLELRAGAANRPGRGHVWLRSAVPLVDGEPADDRARLLGLVDTANGCLPVTPPGHWLFPNTDLTVHLHRPGEGDWLGLDITVSLGADGVGVTSAVLHDREGPFGRSEQTVTVRPR